MKLQEMWLMIKVYQLRVKKYKTKQKNKQIPKSMLHLMQLVHKTRLNYSNSMNIADLGWLTLLFSVCVSSELCILWGIVYLASYFVRYIVDSHCSFNDCYLLLTRLMLGYTNLFYLFMIISLIDAYFIWNIVVKGI